ncbi:hypothetical protein GCM10011583_14620 [Streptomyces camponoticapitis]|uniref:Uncharacterized protein n=1 Tax=Streptomyces camponoticapitis TaxID=1616125 RepID=A0ABQ2E0I1_9ACTN|nr:hypothetical protein [Streptomyces camponoticapitis]GGJ84063.1 hypothetical protein GCM10011583_14620 [Streptomyces camponoticapitis]
MKRPAARFPATPGRDTGGAGPAGDSGCDENWAGERRFAIRCSALLLALFLVVDGGSGHLTALRAVVWTALTVLLFVVLLPARVSAGEDWIASRELLRERTVRTDRLVSVRWSDGVAQRLVLRDLDGDSVEVDPRVLVANPRLWHLLDRGARTSLGRGTLLYGATEMRQLAQRVERDAAKTVFKVSGLI